MTHIQGCINDPWQNYEIARSLFWNAGYKKSTIYSIKSITTNDTDWRKLSTLYGSKLKTLLL